MDELRWTYHVGDILFRRNCRIRREPNVFSGAKHGFIQSGQRDAHFALKNWLAGESAQVPISLLEPSGADPLVRSRRPRRLAGAGWADCVSEERVQGDPRGPGGPPHDHDYAKPHFVR